MLFALSGKTDALRGSRFVPITTAGLEKEGHTDMFGTAGAKKGLERGGR